MLLLRFIVGLVLIVIAIFSYTGLRCFRLPAQSLSTRTVWLLVGAAAVLLIHAAIDLIIYNHAKDSSRIKLLAIPKYRMENKRLLSSSLIVASGVIIGLTKKTGEIIQLDTALLAAAMLIGFINLSVHGGSVDEEIDQKSSETLQEDSSRVVDSTVKLVRVKKFHDEISTWLLNLQIILLIIGIIALR